MILKKLMTGFVVVALISTIFIGCSSAQTSAINLVPQTSNFVAQLQIGKLLDNQALITAYDSISKGAKLPQTVQAALDELSQKTGVNLHDFSQVQMFGIISTVQTDNAGYFGMIAQGTFNHTQFVQNVESKTGKQFTVSTYKGYQLYTDSDQDSIVFFSGSMLVFGTTQAVKDCADIQKGDKQPLSGLILDTYNRLGEASIKAAFAFPAEAQQALQKEIPSNSQISTTALAKMDVAGLSVNVGTLMVTVNSDLHFPDASSAQAAKDTLSGAVTLYKGITTTTEIKNLLGEIQFNTSDVWLNISLQTTLADLQDLSQLLPTK